MMRFSARQQVLRDLRKVLETRESAAITRALLSDEDSDEYALDEYWSNEYERVQRSRYLLRPSLYRRNKSRWLHNRYHTNGTEFLNHFRLRRPEFFRLVAFLKHDPAFKSDGGKTISRWSGAPYDGTT